MFVEPVLALLIDAAFEREIRLGPRTYAGAAVTLLGVAISLLLRQAAARSATKHATKADGKMPA